MIRIKIGDNERDLVRADEQWINQQINRGRADGQTVCVRVIVKKGDLNMRLSTPTFGTSGGGRRSANPHEREVFALWNELGLNDAGFTGGNLVAFLKQLKHLL